MFEPWQRGGRREQYDKVRTEPHEWLEQPFTPQPSHSQLLTPLQPLPCAPYSLTGNTCLQLLLYPNLQFTILSTTSLQLPFYFPPAFLLFPAAPCPVPSVPTLPCSSLPLSFSFLLFPAAPYPFSSASYSSPQLLSPSLQFPTLPRSSLPLPFSFLLFPAAP